LLFVRVAGLLALVLFQRWFRLLYVCHKQV